MSSNTHDTFVRGIFSQLNYAIEFMSKFLPQSIMEIIDIQKLRLTDSSFVDEKLNEFYSDILFEIPFKTGKMSNIYVLFEHKSTPEYDTLLQLLKYQTEIYSKTKMTTPILCLVFYHSEENWTVPERFAEKLKLDKNVISVLEDYILDFRYLLFNIEKVKKFTISFILYPCFPQAWASPDGRMLLNINSST